MTDAPGTEAQFQDNKASDEEASNEETSNEETSNEEAPNVDTDAPPDNDETTEASDEADAVPVRAVEECPRPGCFEMGIKETIMTHYSKKHTKKEKCGISFKQAKRILRNTTYPTAYPYRCERCNLLLPSKCAQKFHNYRGCGKIEAGWM